MQSFSSSDLLCFFLLGFYIKLKHHDSCEQRAKYVVCKAPHGRTNWIVHHLWCIPWLPSVQLLICKKQRSEIAHPHQNRQHVAAKKTILWGVKINQKQSKTFSSELLQGNGRIQITNRSSTEKIFNICLAIQHLSEPTGNWAWGWSWWITNWRLQNMRTGMKRRGERRTTLQARGKKRKRGRRKGHLREAGKLNPREGCSWRRRNMMFLQTHQTGHLSGQGEVAETASMCTEWTGAVLPNISLSEELMSSEETRQWQHAGNMDHTPLSLGDVLCIFYYTLQFVLFLLHFSIPVQSLCFGGTGFWIWKHLKRCSKCSVF